MYRPIDDIENGMVLFDERDYWRCDEEEDDCRDDYPDDEADRRWKIGQEERGSG